MTVYFTKNDYLILFHFNMKKLNMFKFLHIKMMKISFEIIRQHCFVLAQGCSFGTKLMFLYSEKDFNIQRNIFLFRGNFIIFRESFSYSEEVLYSVNFFVFQKIFIMKEILLCSVTFLLYSDKFFIFRKNFVFKETFYIQRKSLCSEKIFIFRENVDIQRKCVYSEKTTNLNFKLFEIQLQDFGRYT